MSQERHLLADKCHGCEGQILYQAEKRRRTDAALHRKGSRADWGAMIRAVYSAGVSTWTVPEYA
jgi:hypothetical protein